MLGDIHTMVMINWKRFKQFVVWVSVNDEQNMLKKKALWNSTGERLRWCFWRFTIERTVGEIRLYPEENSLSKTQPGWKSGFHDKSICYAVPFNRYKSRCSLQSSCKCPFPKVGHLRRRLKTKPAGNKQTSATWSWSCQRLMNSIRSFSLCYTYN